MQARTSYYPAKQEIGNVLLLVQVLVITTSTRTMRGQLANFLLDRLTGGFPCVWLQYEAALQPTDDREV
jgi:hypothetical protein